MGHGNRTAEFFLPKDGVCEDVITADICSYLGRNALVRPGRFDDSKTGQPQDGYFITAYRDLTTAMVTDLKADSVAWQAAVEAEEAKEAAKRKPSGIRYQASIHQQSGEDNGLTRPSPHAELSAAHLYHGNGAGFYLAREPRQRLTRYVSHPDGDVIHRSPTLIDRGSQFAMERTPSGMPIISDFPYEPWRSLPVVEHLAPPKKDLPIYLNGQYFRACADLGAAANVMDAEVARKLRLKVNLDSSCIPFELPTFGKIIKPIGCAIVECQFPGESDSRAQHQFFVFESFVWQVIMGRSFLRQTRTFDRFPHRLAERPLEVHDVPIVAFLPGEEETLKFWLDGEELPSTPDTGSEVNAMSYEFAIKRFTLQPDHITHVRFADGSSQRVEGKVSVPVSFGNGAPPSLLLKLVDLTSRAKAPTQPRSCGPDGAINYGTTASILADFYVLKGLKVDIILGEDVLATVNAFVRHSTDFDELRTPNNLYPALATIITVKGVGRSILKLFGKTSPRVLNEDEMRDNADSRFLDECRKDEQRIRGLQGSEKYRAERRLQRKREEYERTRV